MIFPVTNLKAFVQPEDRATAVSLLRDAQRLIEEDRTTYVCIALEFDAATIHNVEVARDIIFAIGRAIGTITGTTAKSVNRWCGENGQEVVDEQAYRVEWINRMIAELCSD